MAGREAIRYIPREDHLTLLADVDDGANSPLTASHFNKQGR